MRLAFRQTHLYRFVNMEVTPRFELGNEGFADPCLTTWLCHHIRETAFSGRFSVWSGRRGSNSLPRPWQGRALPDELRPRMAPVFQHHGASGRSRTNDTRIFNPLLYQLSYRGISSRCCSLIMATTKGLEPSTSGVTGRRSNQLNYMATFWWEQQGSNL